MVSAQEWANRLIELNGLQKHNHTLYWVTKNRPIENKDGLAIQAFSVNDAGSVACRGKINISSTSHSAQEKKNNLNLLLPNRLGNTIVIVYLNVNAKLINLEEKLQE